MMFTCTQTKTMSIFDRLRCIVFQTISECEQISNNVTIIMTPNYEQLWRWKKNSPNQCFDNVGLIVIVFRAGGYLTNQRYRTIHWIIILQYSIPIDDEILQLRMKKKKYKIIKKSLSDWEEEKCRCQCQFHVWRAVIHIFATQLLMSHVREPRILTT